MISDTLDIDDVWILGGEVQNPSGNDPWCRPSQTNPSGGMVADFEAAPHENPPFGAPWCAFTDRECAGTTRIVDGATFNSKSRTYQLKWIENTGSGGSGFGPFVNVLFGQNVLNYMVTGDTLVRNGYGGIDCSVYDSTTATYLDLSRGRFGDAAAPGPSESIRFDYRTDGVDTWTLEILDVNDVPDRISPNRRESRGAGNVWHHEICGSASWKSVEIPFDSLHLLIGCEWCIPVSFDRTKVAKIRFKVDGSQGSGSLLAIDNVYFPSKAATGTSDFRPAMSAGKQVLHAVYKNGTIRINVPAGAGYSNLTLNILDPRGRVVATRRIAVNGAPSVNVSAERIPDGLYILELSGRTVSGGRSVVRSAVTLMR